MTNLNFAPVREEFVYFVYHDVDRGYDANNRASGHGKLWCHLDMEKKKKKKKETNDLGWGDKWLLQIKLF